MTTFPPHNLTLTRTVTDPHIVHIAITGDLDYDTSEEFLETVAEEMDARPELRELHLDCAELGTCDSMGLSILLMVHRRVTLAGIKLYLDNRQPALNRLLGITGTFRHFIGEPEGGEVPTAGSETRIVHPRDEN
ncbi:STAS domain-containing protein [Streptomyces calidiresistens]|uniref:STAS domain-containing protein n=1 Tax=Streptomyces calidiresistens TaxID=1485586 RepID=A0A7W3T4A9_9ACTN|nr:STAS domain-containing protein [Streptomyces calidiresistens]MBB0230689.1 STAS domain-containing protein [Streptomyces calidiresistens]